MNTNTETQMDFKKFRPMSITYILGVFNDNFFKEAAILLAFAVGLSELQAPIIKYFSLPFILFSAYAGFFADKFPKQKVVIFSKYIELGAMLIGAIGIVTGNFPLIIAMVFMMALQSTLFGPALNGSIPEVFKASHVPKANALIKMVTTVAIIIGIVTAGVAMDITGSFANTQTNILAIAVVITIIAILGIFISYKIPKGHTQKSFAKFPWAGPMASIKDLVEVKKQPTLLKALLGSTFFYFSSTLVLAILHETCLEHYKFSNSFTGALTGILAIGVAIGSIFSIRLCKTYSWQQIFKPAVLLFGLCLLAVSTSGVLGTASVKIHLAVTLFIAGVLGGIFLIPLVTYIQVTPGADKKGKTIGLSNFLDFSGIFIAGELFSLGRNLFVQSTLMAITGMFAILVSICFYMSTPKEKALCLNTSSK